VCLDSAPLKHNSGSRYVRTKANDDEVKKTREDPAFVTCSSGEGMWRLFSFK